MPDLPEKIGEKLLSAFPRYMIAHRVADFPLSVVSDTLTYPGESVASQAVNNTSIAVNRSKGSIAGQVPHFRQIMTDNGVADFYVAHLFLFPPLSYVSAKGRREDGSDAGVVLELSRKLKGIEQIKLEHFVTPMRFCVYSDWMIDAYKRTNGRYEGIYGINRDPRFLIYERLRPSP